MPPHPVSELPAVTAAREATRKGIEAALDHGGFLMAPLVHMFRDDLPQPYLGYVKAREFYRGRDAEEAIARLGLLPAAFRATRVLAIWEHCDLHTAIETPIPATFPLALMSLDATVDTRTIVAQGFELDEGPINPASGLPRFTAHWGNPRTQTRYRLPQVIAQIVESAFGYSTHDPGKVVDMLRGEGFHIALPAR